MDSAASFPHVFITPRRLPDGFYVFDITKDGDAFDQLVRLDTCKGVPDIFAAFTRTLKKEKQALIRDCFDNKRECNFSLEDAFEPLS